MSEPHILTALKDKRARISGLVRKLEKEAKFYREQLVHLDATIKLIAPGVLPEDIIPKRPYVKTPNFRHGEITRRTMDILRRAIGSPLSPPDIAAIIILEKGLNTDDKLSEESVSKRVFEVLKAKRNRGVVEKMPVYGDNRWRISPKT